MEDDYELPKSNQQIARVVWSRGNNLLEVEVGNVDDENFLGKSVKYHTVHVNSIMYGNFFLQFLCLQNFAKMFGSSEAITFWLIQFWKGIKLKGKLVKC